MAAAAGEGEGDGGEEEDGQKKPEFEPLKYFWTNTNRAP
jgi:hypothetical protein